jgi:glutathione S-transferase
MTNAALKVEVPPERTAMAGYGSMAQVMDTLEAACSDREYFVGGRFSAVDVYLGSQIGSGLMFGLIEKRPAFEAYMARIDARPACLRAREIDDCLIGAAKKAPG